MITILPFRFLIYALLLASAAWYAGLGGFIVATVIGALLLIAL